MRTNRYIHNKDNTPVEKVPENENSQEITLENFAELVKQMRHQQRRYFATHSKEILSDCKVLEAQVDSIINKIFDRQMKLF